MNMNELFGNNHEATESNHGLRGTTALTSIASATATRIIKEMEANIDEYRDQITASAEDNSKMDQLLENFKPWCSDDELSNIDYFDEDTVESMLKSQQSKRSRSKSKAMTIDNYRTLMTASIAENLLREIYNKPKSAGGARRTAGMVDFTPAQLEELAADQNRLKKEIRNIQSKKSIMKSKADFDPNSEAWQQLLKVEVMLKDLRVGSNVTIMEVDTTKEALIEMFEGVDLEHIKAADAKDLLSNIAELLK